MTMLINPAKGSRFFLHLNFPLKLNNVQMKKMNMFECVQCKCSLVWKVLTCFGARYIIAQISRNTFNGEYSLLC